MNYDDYAVLKEKGLVEFITVDSKEEVDLIAVKTTTYKADGSTVVDAPRMTFNGLNSQISGLEDQRAKLLDRINAINAFKNDALSFEAAQ